MSNKRVEWTAVGVVGGRYVFWGSQGKFRLSKGKVREF